MMENGFWRGKNIIMILMCRLQVQCALDKEGKGRVVKGCCIRQHQNKEQK